MLVQDLHHFSTCFLLLRHLKMIGTLPLWETALRVAWERYQATQERGGGQCTGLLR